MACAPPRPPVRSIYPENFAKLTADLRRVWVGVTIAHMRVWLLLAGSVLSLASCRKQSSEAFHRLDAEQSVLISRDGDDAYVSNEMDVIIAGLNGVPENALEKDRAVALSGKLRAEQRRVREERTPAVVKAAPPQPAEPLRNLSPPEPVAPVTPPPPPDEDAGPPTAPFAGMEEKAFLALFGRCFSAGEATPGPDGRPAKTQVVVDGSDCLKKFGRPGATRTLYVFVDGRFQLVRTQTLVDAGTPAAPPRPASAADAGERVMTLPGAPVREGYQREATPQ